MLRPKMINLSSSSEWLGSKTTRANSSKKTVFASLKLIPSCFSWLTRSFSVSQVKTISYICTIYVHLEEKSIGKTAEFQLHKRYFSRDNEEEKTSNMHFNLTAPFVTLIARSLVQSTRQSLRERACRLSGALV